MAVSKTREVLSAYSGDVIGEVPVSGASEVEDITAKRIGSLRKQIVLVAHEHPYRNPSVGGFHYETPA